MSSSSLLWKCEISFFLKSVLWENESLTFILLNVMVLFEKLLLLAFKNTLGFRYFGQNLVMKK